MLSNIGSQISLWLGMSIISGFEIVEYIIQLVSMVWNRRNKMNLNKVKEMIRYLIVYVKCIIVAFSIVAQTRQENG